MFKCSICKNKNNEIITTSCEHSVCSKCLYLFILFNYTIFVKTEKIDLEIEMKCMICEKGHFKMSKIKINELLLSSFKDKEENFIFCEECQKNKITPVNKAKLKCKDCDFNLCLQCFDSHPNNHNITNNLDSKNFCIVHTNYPLAFECEQCKVPTCTICERVSHKDHKMLFIQDACKNKKDNLKLTYFGLTFESYLFGLDIDEKKVLNQIKSKIDEFKKDITDLIKNLQDLILFFDNKFKESIENYKYTNKIIKCLFRKLNENTINTPSDDYLKLYALTKLPEQFPKVEFIEKDNKNFIDCLKYNIKKFIEEFKKVKVVEISLLENLVDGALIFKKSKQGQKFQDKSVSTFSTSFSNLGNSFFGLSQDNKCSDKNVEIENEENSQQKSIQIDSIWR
jgi:hypothetical protein